MVDPVEEDQVQADKCVVLVGARTGGNATLSDALAAGAVGIKTTKLDMACLRMEELPDAQALQARIDRTFLEPDEAAELAVEAVAAWLRETSDVGGSAPVLAAWERAYWPTDAPSGGRDATPDCSRWPARRGWSGPRCTCR